MSATQRVKKIIIRFLSDGEVHSAKEIKSFIATQTDEIITEGVTAGCLKTMTTSRIIENVERGMYRLINFEEVNANENIRKEVECEKTASQKIYDKLLRVTQNYKDDALKVINDIDITEENKELIFSAINLRKKIETFCDEIEEYKF